MIPTIVSGFFLPMPIQDRLAYAQNRKDQEPNKLLAKEIVHALGAEGLQELIDFFETKPHKELQKDCSLTIAWVAEQQPELVAPHASYLLSKLHDPINRVIWGSMIALAYIVHHVKKELFEALPNILDAMDEGTVVTRDYGFRIMVTLYQESTLQEDMLVLILEQISKSPSNQLGQYTERLMEVMNKKHTDALITVLEERRNDVSNEHHLRRLNKNLKKLYIQQ